MNGRLALWGSLAAAAAVTVVALATAFLSDWLTRRLVFRPSRRDFGSPADLGIPCEDLLLAGDRGVKVHAWWLPGRGQDGHGAQSPAILFFHGNRGNLSAELATLRFLHSLGADLLAIDYPGYGRSPGRPSEGGCLAAADLAWEHLRSRRPPGEVILYGKSLGGAMAAYLAAREPCGGVVFHGGFRSIPDVAAHLYPRLPLRPFVRIKMDCGRWIAGCRAPLLVLHAPEDDFIPISQGRAVYLRAAVPKRFLPLPGGHYDEGWMRSPAVREALAALLDGSARGWPTDDPV